MSTASQSLLTAAVDGRPLGVFDTRSGGETSAELSGRRPGGSQNEKIYGGGKRAVGDVTLTRVYERERDVELARWLRTRCGKGVASASEQPLDDDDVAWGRPTTWTGRLLSVDTGEYDSDSNDTRMMTIVIKAAEVA